MHFLKAQKRTACGSNVAGPSILTFVATTLFVPYELYEVANKVTVIRIGALTINVAILLFLLLAKRLFGLRGGAEADRTAREADSGWPAFEQLTPGQLSDS